MNDYEQQLINECTDDDDNNYHVEISAHQSKSGHVELIDFELNNKFEVIG